MKIFICFFIILCANNCIAQTTPDFKSFIRNSSLERANASTLKELLDTTMVRFLSLANDTGTALHKLIQNEFSIRKESDHLESYKYPSKLKKKDVSIQYVDYNYVYGVKSEDSTWSTTTLTSLIFVPVMEDLWKGNNISTLCFKAEYEISEEGLLDGPEHTEKKLAIKKIDIDETIGIEIK